MRKIHFWGLCVVTLILLSAGCSKNVPVSGQILYENKPAPDLAVLWEPKSGNSTVAASGLAVTDTNGKFTVRSTGTKERRGIEPGEYTVMIGWKNPAATENTDVPTGNEKAVKPPYQFPEKLTNHAFTVKVPDSGITNLIFRITPQDITYEPQQ